MTESTQNKGRSDIARLEDIPRPLGNQALKRFFRHRIAIVSLAALTMITAVAVFAPAFARYDYDKIDLRAGGQGPTAAHWLGTDRVGRDIWSRLIYGGQVSLAVGVGATLLSTTIGTVLGALSGYYRGLVDNIIMRFTDTVMTFPSIVIMLTLAALLPRSVWSIVLIIGCLSWPLVARLVRGQFLSIREAEFVLAARCLGIGDRRIIVRHIMPNAFAPLIALITFSVGAAILTEAGLSFLGLGVPPPTASWGNILSEGRQFIKCCPWLTTFSGLSIMLAVLSFNIMGDALRDLLDPRLRGD
jgi:peptide/nickel transport system permease protein